MDGKRGVPVYRTELEFQTHAEIPILPSFTINYPPLLREIPCKRNKANTIIYLPTPAAYYPGTMGAQIYRNDPLILATFIISQEPHRELHLSTFFDSSFQGHMSGSPPG